MVIMIVLVIMTIMIIITVVAITKASFIFSKFKLGIKYKKVCHKIVFLASVIDVEVAKTVTSLLRCFSPLLA